MARTVLMVSQVDNYLQTHQVVYIRYAQLVVCQSYLNKVVLKINYKEKTPG